MGSEPPQHLPPHPGCPPVGEPPQAFTLLFCSPQVHVLCAHPLLRGRAGTRVPPWQGGCQEIMHGAGVTQPGPGPSSEKLVTVHTPRGGFLEADQLRPAEASLRSSDRLAFHGVCKKNTETSWLL